MNENIIPFSATLPDEYIATVGMNFFHYITENPPSALVELIDFEQFCDEMCVPYMNANNIAEAPIITYVMRMTLGNHPLTKIIYNKLLKVNA